MTCMCVCVLILLFLFFFLITYCVIYIKKLLILFYHTQNEKPIIVNHNIYRIFCRMSKFYLDCINKLSRCFLKSDIDENDVVSSCCCSSSSGCRRCCGCGCGC